MKNLKSLMAISFAVFPSLNNLKTFSFIFKSNLNIITLIQWRFYIGKPVKNIQFITVSAGIYFVTARLAFRAATM